MENMGDFAMVHVVSWNLMRTHWISLDFRGPSMTFDHGKKREFLVGM